MFKLLQILQILLLIGCTQIQPKHDVITLNEIIKKPVTVRGYEENIDKFQYLLKNSLEVMLTDINMQYGNLNQFFKLKVIYEYDGIFDSIKQRKSLTKHTFSYSIKYQMHECKSGVLMLSSHINSIDSFVTPSHFYADILSAEDSMLTAINNITQQLRLELVHYLQHLSHQ